MQRVLQRHKLYSKNRREHDNVLPLTWQVDGSLAPMRKLPRTTFEDRHDVSVLGSHFRPQFRALRRPPILPKLCLASAAALRPTPLLDTVHQQTPCICDRRAAHSLCWLSTAELLVQPPCCEKQNEKITYTRYMQIIEHFLSSEAVRCKDAQVWCSSCHGLTGHCCVVLTDAGVPDRTIELTGAHRPHDRTHRSR